METCIRKHAQAYLRIRWSDFHHLKKYICISVSCQNDWRVESDYLIKFTYISLYKSNQFHWLIPKCLINIHTSNLYYNIFPLFLNKPRENIIFPTEILYLSIFFFLIIIMILGFRFNFHFYNYGKCSFSYTKSLSN